MNPALPPVVVAAKLSTVMPVGLAVAIIGGLFCLAGWLWLVYQNGRFGLVHGVLSFVIPPYALVYALWELEHVQKSAWTTAFVTGAVIAGLGYAIVFAAEDCENNPECGLRVRAAEEATQSADESDEGSLYLPAAPSQLYAERI